MDDKKHNSKLGQKRLIVIAVSVISLLVLVFLILAAGSRVSEESGFSLVRTTPEQDSIVTTDNTTVKFEFNEELPIIQDDDFRVSVSPEVEHVHGVLRDSVNVNLSDLVLEDNTTYTVSLLNVTSRSGETIGVVSVTFTVEFGQKTTEFLNELPYETDDFSVVRTSDRTLYIRVSGKPYDESEERVLDLLESRGVSRVKFNIDIDRPDDPANRQGDESLHFH